MDFLPILLDVVKVASGAAIVALINYKRSPISPVSKTCESHSDLIAMSTETNTLIQTFIPTVEKSISEAREDRILLFQKTDVLEKDVAKLQVKINHVNNTQVSTLGKSNPKILDCLVLDDYPDLAESVSIQLESFSKNYDLKLCCDNVSSFKDAERFLESKLYDLAFVDMYLNSSQSGLDFIETYSRKFPLMKFLLYSGRKPDSIPTCFRNIFLSKPFDRNEVISKLDFLFK